MNLLKIVCGGAWALAAGAAPAWSQDSRLNTYEVYYTRKPPGIDGKKLHQWKRARWSTDFIDIEGTAQPRPEYRTRTKMLWDDEYLYILAVLEEPHLWATLENQDDIIYRDHDFEVFLDPDGDTHHYLEIEINARGAVMDLLMDRPYRHGGKPAMDWTATGMQKAIGLRGTLNDNRDSDRGWVVEMALPMAMIKEATGVGQPKIGTTWRINFSRVAWLLDFEGRGYRKRINPATGKPFPERNWVWSPQGAIDMHIPERWGYLKFMP